jgi:hypothetical protein
MTDKEIDELDERRAKAILDLADFSQTYAQQIARAIRLSDEAAGYELCKRVEHRGVIG